MIRTILIISIFSLLHLACHVDTAGRYKYRPPEKINDGMEVGTLEEVNVKSKWIERAVNEIQRGRYKEVHAMLIFRDNKLVLEEYFRGHAYLWEAANHHGGMVSWNREMLHNVMSVTKSITSICVGIAVDKGFIKNVHQSIFDYLPEHRYLATHGKEKITIEHLLTMTSGLEWREWSAPYSSPENPVIGIWFQDKDPISYILEKPLLKPPGTSFNYSSGNTVVLGEIIRNASQMTIDEFSERFLSGPLGGDTLNWWLQYENGVFESAGSLKMRPRTMVKIGAVFLHRGFWKDKQIISDSWVEKSAASYGNNHGINVPGEPSGKLGYSYSWWTKDFVYSGRKIRMYTASGWGGQHIMVLPELNAVVVFTCGNFTTKRPPFRILERFIIPALL